MPSRAHLTRWKLLAAATVVGLSISLVAQAGAHSTRISSRFLRGYYGTHAVVTGTVSTVGASSFAANAYVVMPGAGGSSSTPATTAVTITPGTATTLVVNGQKGAPISAVATGDRFYAVYGGVSSSASITTITAGTPTKVIAFAPPTPTFVVEGTITTAPVSGNPDQFIATASIVQPRSHGRFGYGRYRHRKLGSGYSYGASVDGFGFVHLRPGGSYGFDAAGFRRHSIRPSSSTSTTATTGVLITVDDTTKLDVNGNTSATVSSLAAGQKFVAVFDGSPSTASLSSLPLAVAVYARSVYQAYGFVGSVTGTVTGTPAMITVAVTQSFPSGLFSGTDAFDVGSGTQLVGRHGRRLHSLSDIATGDTVAGGLVEPAGETATQLEGQPLQYLLDWSVGFSPGPGFSNGSKASAAAFGAAEAKLKFEAKKADRRSSRDR